MGTLQVALLGCLGAAIPEALRIVASLRSKITPSGREIVASLILIALGCGVLLFNVSDEAPFQIAVLGAAFPSIFSSATAAATAPPGVDRGGHGRKVADYISWRL